MVGTRKEAFTLIELLIVIAILGVLVGLLVPALQKAKVQARQLRGTGNQKSIVSALHYYALDHRGRFPPSTATMGPRGSYWNWLEPTTVTTYYEKQPLHAHRSLSGFLYNYIDDPKVLYCPNVPEEYPYMQEAWEAGDDWDNPETGRIFDPLFGSYSFYWGYLGHTSGSTFQGPRTTWRSRGERTLLVSDTFAYDNWRCPDAFISCEKFRQGGDVPRAAVSSGYWYCLENDGSTSLNSLKIRLQGGFVDGHVESYSTAKVTPMQISITSNGSMPNKVYGTFYLPISSLY